MGVVVMYNPMPRMVFLEGPWKRSQSRVHAPQIGLSGRKRRALAIVLVKQSHLCGKCQNGWSH